MKKIVSLFLAVVLMISLLPSTYAKTMIDKQIEYFSDGSYIVTVLSEDSFHYLRNSVTRSKTKYCYNALDDLIFSITITASFYYTTGAIVKVTSHSPSYAIQNNAWTCASITSSAINSGVLATATASGSFVNSFVTRDVSVSISCDNYGNIS